MENLTKEIRPNEMGSDWQDGWEDSYGTKRPFAASICINGDNIFPSAEEKTAAIEAWEERKKYREYRSAKSEENTITKRIQPPKSI